jgi:hypothetical protein
MTAETIDHQPTEVLSATQRLAQIRRTMQRMIRRKPTPAEALALDHAAMLALRAEAACRDINCDANTIVRLSNAARRARLDFEEIARFHREPRPPNSFAEIGV